MSRKSIDSASRPSINDTSSFDLIDIASQGVGHCFGDLRVHRHDFLLGDFALFHVRHSILKPPSTLKTCPVT